MSWGKIQTTLPTTRATAKPSATTDVSSQMSVKQSGRGQFWQLTIIPTRIMCNEELDEHAGKDQQERSSDGDGARYNYLLAP